MMEIYIVPTSRDPELLLYNEYIKDIDELKAFYENMPRDYWKRKIVDGEELGMINFYHPVINESIFVFNNTSNFKKAIQILEDFCNDELLVKLSFKLDELSPLKNPYLNRVLERLYSLEVRSPRN